MSESTIVFGEFRLDPDALELRRAGQLVETAPLTLRLLIYLAENRDRTVPREELLGEVWQGVAVGETSLHQALKLARRATGDSGSTQRVIKTVRGRGYRFVAEVEEAPEAVREDAARIVGREALLGELADQLETTMRHAGRVVLLRGEPGIGKTRLASEFAARASRRGVRVGRSTGVARAGAPPYWSWIRLIRDLSTSRPTRRLRDQVESLMPQLLDPSHPPKRVAEQTADETERFRIFDSVSQALIRIGEIGPLMLLLDDLHEAGASALALLSFVAAEIGSTPIMIVGTYRQAELLRDPEAARFIGEIEQLGTTRTIALSPLDTQQTRELIGLHLHTDHLDSLVDRIAEHSGGNPFYAIEIAHAIDSRLRQHADSVEPGEAERWLPDGIRQLIGDRCRSLNASTRHVLRSAALLGGRIDRSLLSAVEPDQTVPAALDEAAAAGLLVESEAHRGRYAFSHDLVREAIHQEIRESGEQNERRVHLRIAEALLEQDPDDLLGVAHHLGAAAPLGEPRRSIDYLRRAAEHAASVYDGEEAWRLHQQALAIFERAALEDAALYCDLLIGAGESAVSDTRADEARGLLRTAIDVARENDFGDRFCRGVLGLAYRDEILGVAENDVAMLLEEAIDEFAEPASPDRIRLLSALALKIRYQPGAYGRALELIDESVTLARVCGDAGGLARVLEDASFIRWSVEDPEGWIRLNHEIVEAASAARDLGLLFRGVKGLATGCMEIGDRDGMEREMARCRELARTAPAPYLRAVCELHAGAIALLDGQLDAGEAHALAALASGLPAILPLASVQLFYHRLETNRIGELETATRSLVQTTPGISAWRYAMARLLVGQERIAEAHEELRRAGPLADLPRDRNWLAAGSLAAEAAIRIGDTDLCAELYRTLAPHARVNVVLGHGSLFFGNAGHFVGLLARELGDEDTALRLLENARAVHERMRSTPWIERSQSALSERVPSSRRPRPARP